MNFSDYYDQSRLIFELTGIHCGNVPILGALSSLRIHDRSDTVYGGSLLSRIAIGSHFARLFLSIDAPTDAPDGETYDGGDIGASSDRLPIHVFLEGVGRLAKRHGHASLDEMHFMLVGLELFGGEFHALMGPTIARHRQQYPNGTPVEQRIIEVAKSKSEQLANKYILLAAETPFSVGATRRKIERYLASTYYPYSVSEFEAFRKTFPSPNDLEPEERPQYSATAFAFACHRAGR